MRHLRLRKIDREMKAILRIVFHSETAPSQLGCDELDCMLRIGRVKTTWKNGSLAFEMP